jgi:glycosyltransferase involved in cell wall biosynthesis
MIASSYSMINDDKKIVIFAGVSELDSRANGYMGRWDGFFNALSSKNRKTQFLTTDFVHSTRVFFKKNIQGYKIFRCGGYAKNISVRRAIYNMCFTTKAFVYLLFKATHGREVVLIINSIPPELSVLTLLKFIRGYKVILDVRDVWPQSINAARGRRRSLPIRAWGCWCNCLNRLAVRNADAVLVTSRKYCQDLGLIPDKVTFIPLGFDANRWRFATLQVDRAQFVAGYIGNAANQYHLDAVIAFFRRLGIRLEIIGNFPEEYVRKNPDVVFHGYKRAEEQESIISDWTVGVLPDLSSSGPGLPNKLFDYIGALRPIVVVKSVDEKSEVDRFIESYGIGVLVHKNAETSQSELMLQRLINLPDLNDRLKLANKKYSRSVLASKFLTTVEALGGNRL